jgi:hypothetical protein
MLFYIKPDDPLNFDISSPYSPHTYLLVESATGAFSTLIGFWGSNVMYLARKLALAMDSMT